MGDPGEEVPTQRHSCGPDEFVDPICVRKKHVIPVEDLHLGMESGWRDDQPSVRASFFTKFKTSYGKTSLQGPDIQGHEWVEACSSAQGAHV